MKYCSRCNQPFENEILSHHCIGKVTVTTGAYQGTCGLEPNTTTVQLVSTSLLEQNKKYRAALEFVREYAYDKPSTCVVVAREALLEEK